MGSIEHCRTGKLAYGQKLSQAVTLSVTTLAFTHISSLFSDSGHIIGGTRGKAGGLESGELPIRPGTRCAGCMSSSTRILMPASWRLAAFKTVGWLSVSKIYIRVTAYVICTPQMGGSDGVQKALPFCGRRRRDITKIGGKLSRGVMQFALHGIFRNGEDLPSTVCTIHTVCTLGQYIINNKPRIEMLTFPTITVLYILCNTNYMRPLDHSHMAGKPRQKPRD